MKHGTLSLAGALLTVAALTFIPSCHRKETKSIEEQKDTVYPLGFCTDSFALAEGVVKNGEIFMGLMTRLGLTPKQTMDLVSASDSVFSPGKMRAGNPWQAYYTLKDSTEQVLEFLVYNENKIEMTVFKCTEPFGAWKVTRPVDHVRKFADVKISSSLWNDMRRAGAPQMLILHLEDIYAWTVDFFSIQPGDRFSVMYDEALCGGEVIDIDTVYYAEFSHGGKCLPAIRLDQGDGGNVYWNEKGESMKKAFLKAPLRFSRISSGFSYRRKHPVTGRVKAHTGVDYAAPTGTPVMSIGDGTVISKGWSGGGGNTVKIRHNSVYTTAYLHLSRYASGLKVGARVRQGDVIGYVGATGVATGPHLDFRVWKGGSPINPLTMESPSAEPVRPENLPLLDSLYKTLSVQLQALVEAKDSVAVRDSVKAL